MADQENCKPRPQRQAKKKAAASICELSKKKRVPFGDLTNTNTNVVVSPPQKPTPEIRKKNKRVALGDLTNTDSNVVVSPPQKPTPETRKKKRVALGDLINVEKPTPEIPKQESKNVAESKPTAAPSSLETEKLDDPEFDYRADLEDYLRTIPVRRYSIP